MFDRATCRDTPVALRELERWTQARRWRGYARGKLAATIVVDVQTGGAAVTLAALTTVLAMLDAAERSDFQAMIDEAARDDVIVMVNEGERTHVGYLSDALAALEAEGKN